MIRAAKQGKRVVRLKGGDPFVFGRGGEEALALAMAGIPFEVVPGVTTAVAAPELAGIPVTHRGIASAFLVLAGHTSEAVENTLRVGAAEQRVDRDDDGHRRARRAGVAADRARMGERHAGGDRLRASTPDEWTWTGPLVGGRRARRRRRAPPVCWCWRSRAGA